MAAMTEYQIENRLVILLRRYNVPYDYRITGEPIDSLGLDSLDLAELFFDIQVEFKIEIPEEAAAKWKIVQDVVYYLTKNI
jgi:acyl carrier protein